MSVDSNSLVLMTQADRMLAEANTVQKAKDLKDLALTVADWAKRKGLGEAAIQRATTYARAAELKMGEILLNTDLSKGAAGKPGPGRGKKNAVVGGDSVLTLPEMGISRDESSDAKLLASMPMEKQEAYRVGKLPKSQAKRDARKEKVISEITKRPETASVSLEELIEQGKQFSTVYADPPWPYDNQATRASTDNHYPTLSVEQICALPIREISARLAHLHLWTTTSFLREALAVLDAWGFEYKSCFVWVKPQMGIGNYWRVSHEFLLLGVRGNCPFLTHAQKSWLQADRVQHSSKPAEIRNLVEEVSPNPRIELFARESVEGWTCWGNELP